MSARSVCRLLVIEDQKDLAENIAEYFDGPRYLLDFASNGLTALHLLASGEYDMVILDLMLPGISGQEICRRIRQDLRSNVPVIITTARGALSDKEEGFLGGANDYLVKPFHLRELELRIESLLRRGAGVDVALQLEALKFNPDAGIAELEGRQISLGGIPARIFEHLMRSHPRSVSHQDMLTHIWGESDADANTIRTHIYALRRLFQEGLGHPLIATVHGRGYRLSLPGEDKPA